MSTLTVVAVSAALALVWIVGIITGTALAGIWRETRLIKKLEQRRQTPDVARVEVFEKVAGHEIRPTMH